MALVRWLGHEMGCTPQGPHRLGQEGSRAIRATETSRWQGRGREEARRAGSLLLQVWTTRIQTTAPDAIERVEALLREAEARHIVLARLVALVGLGGLYEDRGRHLEGARMTKTMQAALDTLRQVAGPDFVADFENNLGTSLIGSGAVEEGRALLLSSLNITDSLGLRHIALYPIEGLAEVLSGIGEWRDALVLFSAWQSVSRDLGILSSARSEVQAVIDATEEHLDPEGAAEARAIGEAMSYREAVDFAFEINGMTPP